MKIRSGFVSNSSSASFVIIIPKEEFDRGLLIEDVKRLFPMDKKVGTFIEREEAYVAIWRAISFAWQRKHEEGDAEDWYDVSQYVSSMEEDGNEVIDFYVDPPNMQGFLPFDIAYFLRKNANELFDGCKNIRGERD